MTGDAIRRIIIDQSRRANVGHATAPVAHQCPGWKFRAVRATGLDTGITRLAEWLQIGPEAREHYREAAKHHCRMVQC